MATPVFQFNAGGQCVMPYLFYPMKAGESLPVQSVKVKKGGTIEIRFRNGDKDVIRYAVGDNSLKQLSLTTRQGGKRESVPIL